MFKKGLLVFLSGLAWYALMIPWNGFPDPDAFYHAKISLLIWQHGPIVAFPWLDLTTLGTAFADHHFLFHLIEAPFVAAFGWATGGRLTAVALASAFLTVAYICFRILRLRQPEIWTALLALTSPLIMRLLLAKASPLALLLFMLGLVFVWKRKPLAAGLIGFLFALSHGGWIYLLGSAAFLLVGGAIHRRVVDGQSWREMLNSSGLKEWLAVCLGSVLGTMLHPNFPSNLSFLWVQVVKIGLETPYQHVFLGREWLPAEPVDVLVLFSLWAVALLVGLGGLMLAARKPLDRDMARAATAFAWPVAVILALTLKSRRNVEYLSVALALWIPWIWNLIDFGAFRRTVIDGWSRVRRRVTVIGLGLLIFLMAVKGVSDAHSALCEAVFPDASFQEAMASISALANPGDRVFHSDWDEFPMLFHLDDRLRYVAGLDPTFLYEASSTLSDAYRDLTWKTASATREQAWDVVHERLRARFVLIARRDHQALADLLNTDARFRRLIETDDSVAYIVEP